MNRDLMNNIATVQLLAPQDKAHTNWTSLVLDTAGFEGACLELQVGAFTGEDASNYLTVTLQESADTVGADFTAAASLDVQLPGSAGTTSNPNWQEVTAASVKISAVGNASQAYLFGYFGGKRYIRLNAVYTGTGISAGLVGATGILGFPAVKPAVAPAAITAS